MTHYSRRIWYHNSLRGRIAFCLTAARAVIDSETTTVSAKAHAIDIYHHATQLLEALNERNPNFEEERLNAKSHRPPLR